MVVASDSSRNVFAQQIFTLKQNSMIPKAIFKKILQRKDALETRLTSIIMSSSSLFLFLFFCYYWHGKYAFE